MQNEFVNCDFIFISLINRILYYLQMDIGNKEKGSIMEGLVKPEIIMLIVSGFT